MKVYHTSTLPIKKPDTLHSRPYLDFGKGFYVTALKEQAVKYSARFLKLGSKAFLSTYEYTPNTALKVKLNLRR